MTNITLEPYTITVRKRRNKERQVLGGFDGSSSLREFIQGVLDNIKKQKSYKIDSLTKAIVIDPLEYTNTGTIQGNIRNGIYGFASNIIDSESGQVSYQKKKSDADLIPMYFRFYVPDNSTKGILLAQTFGASGLKQIIENIIVTYFRHQYPEYILEIKPLVPSEAVEQFLKSATINKVRFIKHSIPSDYADVFRQNAGEREGEIELMFKPKDKHLFSLDKMLKYFDGDLELGELYEVDDFEYDNIKVEMTVGTENKTLNFLYPHRISAAFNATTTVARGKDGFPKYTALKDYAEGIILDCSKKLGIK